MNFFHLSIVNSVIIGIALIAKIRSYVSKEAFGTYDFYKAKDIIREGEEAGQRALAQLSRKQ